MADKARCCVNGKLACGHPSPPERFSRGLEAPFPARPNPGLATLASCRLLRCYKPFDTKLKYTIDSRGITITPDNNTTRCRLQGDLQIMPLPFPLSTFAPSRSFCQLRQPQ